MRVAADTLTRAADYRVVAGQTKSNFISTSLLHGRIYPAARDGPAVRKAARRSALRLFHPAA